MTLTLKPHEYSRDPDTGAIRLTSVRPYVRLSRRVTDKEHQEGIESAALIFIQGGSFYTADGEQTEESDLPEWAKEEMKKLTPRARREAGLEPKPDASSGSDRVHSARSGPRNLVKSADN